MPLSIYHLGFQQLELLNNLLNMEENGGSSIVTRFALFCNFITNKTRLQSISKFKFEFKSEFQFPVDTGFYFGLKCYS